MELNDKVTRLEDEIKILKNEVQAVLLDLRESCLNRENPFNPGASPVTSQPIIINQPAPVAHEQPPIPKERQGDMIPTENEEKELPGVQERANEPEPLYKEGLATSEETAREEVKRAWRPETEPGAHFKSRETTDGPVRKIDMATVAGLAQWVTEAVKRLGRERTEAILDISEMMGHVAPDLKNILVKFIKLTPDGYPGPGKVTTRDYLASLIELDSLLGKDNKSEVALLSILCQENDHG